MNTNKQMPLSGLCERVIRGEATETEGLVYYQNLIIVCLFVCLFVHQGIA